MIFSIIALPEGGIAEITASLGYLITDLWPLIALLIGIPLAFYVMEKLIDALRIRGQKIPESRIVEGTGRPSWSIPRGLSERQRKIWVVAGYPDKT